MEWRSKDPNHVAWVQALKELLAALKVRRAGLKLQRWQRWQQAQQSKAVGEAGLQACGSLLLR